MKFGVFQLHRYQRNVEQAKLVLCLGIKVLNQNAPGGFFALLEYNQSAKFHAESEARAI